MSENKGNGGVDLSGLEGFDMSFGSLINGGDAEHAAAPTVQVVRESTGEPLQLLIADIEEDPDQPRHEFPEGELEEMAASIKERGVRSPISVRPHPINDGKWILNHGARRYRGSIRAGKLEIPAFIDTTHDNYDQVVENIQRENLTPLEIAQFIAKRKALGEKPGAIAKRLGKAPAFVSKHSALIDMPDSIQQAYDAGRCREVEALYLMVRAYKENAAEIDALCLNTENATISKYTVQALLDALKQAQEAADAKAAKNKDLFGEQGQGEGEHAGQGEGEHAGQGEGEHAGQGEGEHAGQGEGEHAGQGEGEHAGQGEGEHAGQGEGEHAGQGEGEHAGQGEGEQQNDKIRRPIVQIRHDERPARLLLDRRSAIGLAWIKYDDDGAEVEIDIGTAKLVALVEGA